MQKDEGTNYRGKMGRTEEQKELGVKFLLFNPETRKLRWSQHKSKPNEEKTIR